MAQRTPATQQRQQRLRRQSSLVAHAAAEPPARASLPQAEHAPAPDWIRLGDAEPKSRFGIPCQLTAFAEHGTGEARTDALLKKPVP